MLFAKLIAKAKSLGYNSLRITTGSQNEAMRALAQKFGAQLVFRRGESSGSIDLTGAVFGDASRCRAREAEFQPRLLVGGVSDL
jgi:hypothetical protein